MASDPTVSVVVKCAGGAVDDLTVDCPLSSRAAHLKDLISAAYPGTPAPSRLKLIHAGRLLKDDAALSDVFRFFEDGMPQIVHLVVREDGCSATPSAPATPVPSRASSRMASTPTPGARPATPSSSARPIPQTPSSPLAYGHHQWDPAAAQAWQQYWMAASAASPMTHAAPASPASPHFARFMYVPTMSPLGVPSGFGVVAVPGGVSSPPVVPPVVAQAIPAHTVAPVEANAQPAEPAVAAAAVAGNAAPRANDDDGNDAPVLGAGFGGGANVDANDDWDNPNQRETPIKLFFKLALLVFIFSQGARQRIMCLSAVAFCVFLFQVLRIRVVRRAINTPVDARVRPIPRPDAANNNVAVNEHADNVPNGEQQPNEQANAEHANAEGVPAEDPVEDGVDGTDAQPARGFLGDVEQIVTTFFSSLIPNNRYEGLAN
eukprot:Opistho-1_new@75030